MKNLPSDTLLSTTLRAIGDGVISCDREGRVVLMNAVAQQLTGWTEQDAMGNLLKEVFVIVHEKTRTTVEDPVDKVLRLGKVVGLANHTILIRRDGSEVAIDDSAAPVHDADGQLRGVVLVFRDVTDRRRAELNLELLAESGDILGEARDVSAITTRVGLAVSRHFADFCIFDLLTPTADIERVIGPHRDPAQQPIADGLMEFVPRPEDSVHPTRSALMSGKAVLLNNITDETMQAAAMNAEHLAYFRNQLRPKSVIVVPMEANGEKLGAISFLRNLLATPFNDADLVAAQELTKRVGLAFHYARMREELGVQRARVDAILTAIPVGLLVAEPSGKILEGNEELDRIFRHKLRYSEDTEAHAEYIAFHPDGRQVQGNEYPLPRAMAQDKVFRNERYLYQRGDGTKAWISLSAAPVKDASGKILGGVVAVSDIDELVHAHEAAERNRERLETMMDRASVGIAVGDLQGGLKYANETLLKWIGYSKQEMLAGEVRWDQLTPAQYADKDEIAVKQLQERGYASAYEKVYTAKGGHLVPLLVGATMVPALDEETKQDVAVFFTNLSLQKEAEAALLQTEKLTAVGRLASSISHEINNPLEAVTNLLYIVRNDPTLSQGGKDYLGAADRELARVSHITAQTLRFHRQSTAATLVQPQGLVEEVLSIYASRFENASIAITRKYADDVAVTCYEGDIRQVLNNLINNAFASMQGGGHLQVSTRYATWWPTSERGVRITVADTGSGIDPETLPRIFEAFFTTKGIHGTGLGLWISRRIVHKHRGHMVVRSRAKTGRHYTIFDLWLPLELAATARDAWYADPGEKRDNAGVLTHRA